MDFRGWIPPEAWIIVGMGAVICVLLGCVVTPWLINHIHITVQ